MKKLYFIPPFVIQSTLWWLVMRPIFSMFAKLEITGREHLEDISGPVIFAPNHSNEVDPVLLPLTLPFWGRFSPLFFVARERKYYQKPFFGLRGRFLYNELSFALLGAYPVLEGKKNYALSLKDHLHILKDGGSVVIFPEGHMTKDGNLGPAHGGVGYLSYASNLPIVPVYIHGTFRFNFHDLFAFKKRMSVDFAKPLFPSELFDPHKEPTVEDFQTVGGRVLDEIRKQADA
jgi:1-acyl-sn-glycerol-3-phosphate acyltransferase